MSWSDAWSTQQLVEFTAALPGCASTSEIAWQAVQRAAEALDGDVAALVRGERVLAVIGFPAGRVPDATLLSSLASGRLSVPGMGECPVLSAPVDGEPVGRLLLARAGAGFSVEETSLVRGMGRVLSLAISQLELVGELRSRQRLLEQLGLVQAALARRAPLQQVLDAITTGARELLAADVVALRLSDSDDPRLTVLVSQQGITGRQSFPARRLPLTVGLAGRAMTAQQLVSVEDYTDLASPVPSFVGELYAGMATPVREEDRIVGALMVASTGPERRFSPDDRQTLIAFADHVSLALTDAHTLAAVQHARHDPLSGLPGRGLFLDSLAGELTDAAHSGRPTAVLFIDLDRFKTVNDTLGHAAGDELLVAVAARVRTAVREQDTTGRLGGDEFAVLLPGADTQVAAQVAGRVLEALRAPVSAGGRQVSAGASIGLASTASAGTQRASAAVGTGAGQAAELLRDADLAMYWAKSRGGQRYEIFAPAMSATVLRRAQLTEDLSGALDASQLWLALQPIVDLRTDRPVGAEALLRWSHPTRGLIPPSEFIPLAEHHGLLAPISRWVLREACALAVGWPQPTDGLPLTVAVNLSACQLSGPTLVDEVVAALGDTGLDPPRLTLEITESLLIRDVKGAVVQLHRLKELGVRIAIDDFGTGYSSLAYLARFPIDILKIDRAFVAGMSDSPQAAALTEAVVRLAEFMHLQVIAEGIETAEQLQHVRSLGCHHGQGYALGLPTHAHLFPDRSYPPENQPRTPSPKPAQVRRATKCGTGPPG